MVIGDAAVENGDVIKFLYLDLSFAAAIRHNIVKIGEVSYRPR